MSSIRSNNVSTHTSSAPAGNHHDRPRTPSSPRGEHTIGSPPKLRPEAARSSTDPSPSALVQNYLNNKNDSTSTVASTLRHSGSQRNQSPYARSHLRSRSSGAALSAPIMTRAHSSPAMHSTARPFDLNTPTSGSLSSSSPLRSPARQRSPFRQEETSYNLPIRSSGWFDSPSSGGAIEAIQEESELDITPRQPLPMHSMPFARSSSLRRRPASPLHSVTNALTSTPLQGNGLDHGNTSVASPGPNSPALAPQRFNEAYPPLHHYASSSSFSSIPSTPTSQRSRSPSISSLDTIEDAPDLEDKAIEAERIERLRLAAERAERGEDDDESLRRRSSLDVPRGFGFSRGGNREKKRWSVCGGERRADLDLETIWED